MKTLLISLLLLLPLSATAATNTCEEIEGNWYLTVDPIIYHRSPYAVFCGVEISIESTPSNGAVYHNLESHHTAYPYKTQCRILDSAWDSENPELDVAATSSVFATTYGCNIMGTIEFDNGQVLEILGGAINTAGDSIRGYGTFEDLYMGYKLERVEGNQ